MESISDQLQAAATDVERADLPKDLQPSAFVLAFWARNLSSTIAGRDTPVGGPTIIDPDQPSSDRPALVAQRLSLDAAQVETIFDFTADEIDLIVSPRLLDTTNVGAALEIAYLLAAARQACGEQWTDGGMIRDAVQERGRYDGNFNRVFTQIDGNGASVKKDGRDRRIKLNAVGFERATEIAKRLAAPGASS